MKTFFFFFLIMI